MSTPTALLITFCVLEEVGERGKLREILQNCCFSWEFHGKVCETYSHRNLLLSFRRLIPDEAGLLWGWCMAAISDFQHAHAPKDPEVVLDLTTEIRRWRYQAVTQKSFRNPCP